MSLRGLLTSWTWTRPLLLKNMWLTIELVMGPLRFTSRKNKNVRDDHETWGPKRPIFKPTLSILMIQRVLQWEMQKWFSCYKCHGEKVKHEESCQYYPFWTYILKKPAHPFFGAWSLLLVHIRFTPSQGPEGFKNAFKKIEPWKCYDEVWPWKNTI